MKTLKNIIRIAALASLSLSISPLTTAKAAAADAIQVTKTAGTTTVNPTATDGSDIVTKLASTDPESPETTVSVTVVSGVLTLDAVPDFNFGTMAKGTTVKLKNNVADTSGFQAEKIGQDGTVNSPEGYLQMTDSRNLTNPEDMPGFTLTASMGKLMTSDYDATAGTGSSLDAILHLSALSLKDTDNNNVSNSGVDLKTEAAKISSTDDTPQTIIDMKRASYKPGVIRAQYNTPDSASLTSMSDGTTSTDASSKNMNAVITWTLTANPTVTTPTTDK